MTKKDKLCSTIFALLLFIGALYASVKFYDRASGNPNFCPPGQTSCKWVQKVNPKDGDYGKCQYLPSDPGKAIAWPWREVPINTCPELPPVIVEVPTSTATPFKPPTATPTDIPETKPTSTSTATATLIPDSKPTATSTATPTPVPGSKPVDPPASKPGQNNLQTFKNDPNLTCDMCTIEQERNDILKQGNEYTRRLAEALESLLKWFSRP